jgi:ribosomal protein S19
MSRSKWKNFYINSKLLKKNILLNQQHNIKFRNSLMAKTINNQIVLIYTGKEYKKVYVAELKTQYKLGEFVFTRSKFFHKNKIKPLKVSSKKKIIKKK